MAFLRQKLTILEPILWKIQTQFLSPGGSPGNSAVRLPVFSLHFLKRITKRYQLIFIFLKFAFNSAYFEPKMTFLRQKLTILEPIL